MRIEEVAIDGFKSYAKRVVVSNFDKSFNAITGLNGSGKSNILDSLCFVMGIKKLDTVRANSTSDLVYKQGQAGITKASVSVTFSTDDNCTPAGYDDKKKIVVTRQVVVGGKDKYMINGVNAQPKRVQDLFQSVSLNVNNPHFLIMQGRITKVLNMTPPQILAMLEEAAGTKMYVEKSKTAVTTLQKKEKKLKEIDRVLDQSIKPDLEKLRSDKTEYQEWQLAVSKAEQLEHIVAAHRYWEVRQSGAACKEQIDRTNETLANAEETQETMKKEIKAAEKRIKQLKAEQEAESSEQMRKLTKAADDAGIKLAKRKAAVEAAQEDLQSHTAELQKVDAALEAASEERMIAAATQAQQHLETCQADLAAAQQEVESAKAEVAGIESGNGRDEKGRSMPERLRDLEADIKQRESVVKKAHVSLKHLKQEAEKADRDAAAKQGDDAQLQLELQSKRSALQAAQATHDGVVVDEDRMQQLQRTIQKERAAVQQLSNRRRGAGAGVSQVFDFKFTDPRPGFNRSTVRGILANLVRLKDAKHALALEVAAGAKLMHLVVNTEQVGADLIEKKCLRNRSTIVPLDKTRAFVVPAQKCESAKRVTHNRALLATELVHYDEDVRVAINHAFGGTFVCDDEHSARKCMEANEVRCRAVSLQGDEYNPNGTMSGGSRNNAPILTRLQELQSIDAELEQHETALAEAERQLAELTGQQQQRAAAAEKVQLATHALQLVESRVASSAAHTAQQHADTLKQQLDAAQQEQDAAEVQKAELQGRAQELRDRIKNFDKDRGPILAAAKKRFDKAGAALQTAQAAHATAEEDAGVRDAEQERAADERAELAQARQAVLDAQSEAEAAVKTAQAAADAAHAANEDAEGALAEYRAEVEQRGAQVREAQTDRADLEAEQARSERELKKAKGALKNLEAGAADIRKELKQLEQKNKWLLQVRDELGVEGGQYDFDALDMEAKKGEYARALEETESKKGGLDMSIISRFETAEKECGSLEKRRKTVQEDRDTILKSIQELDGIRLKVLDDTWRDVNVTFGEIFSTLLPGTDAKLALLDSGELEDGLEVKVAFGGLWKQSLSELSGGQRSLVALSLVFALLKTRPAPLYILDEVDAALDLSHTTNIGKMIKEQFPCAQFIVVSLKEGMFNNANVIFRTRFVDGSSTVQRTLGGGGAGAGSSGGGTAAQAAKKSRVGGQRENRAAVRA